MEIYLEEKKVGVARLKLTRYDNSKGSRIGPSLFYTSELYSKYIKFLVLLDNQLLSKTLSVSNKFDNINTF